MTRGLLLEEGVDERLGLEGGQVVGPLPQADELDGHPELTLHGDHDAALGRAIQLREHDARDTSTTSEKTFAWVRPF